jgi:chromosome partitioning protein
MSDTLMDTRSLRRGKPHGKIITITSPKGGVGKTTIARCLLVAAAQANLRCIGYDADPQRSLAKWAARRQRTRDSLPDRAFVETPVTGINLTDWRDTLRQAANFELAIIDTPPSVETNLPAIYGLCEAATVVLVPTGATRDDLDSVLPWMTKLVGAGVRALFVMNRTNRRTSSFGQSRSRLLKVGAVCPVEIPALEDIHSQSDHGLTALDIARSRALEPLQSLWDFAARELAD